MYRLRQFQKKRLLTKRSGYVPLLFHFYSYIKLISNFFSLLSIFKFDTNEYLFYNLIVYMVKIVNSKEGEISMLYFIKTAIITIIISFISGLLLEYYKGLAPRILCNVQNGVPIHLNSRKICTYIITVINTSNKTIHELTLDIQSPQAGLKSIDAKITRGLRFDSSMKNNILDFYIPFLCKDDKFSVTVYEENMYAANSRPVVTIRSPENFKKIDSSVQNGILSSLLNIPKSIEQVIFKTKKRDRAIIPNKINDFPAAMNKSLYANQTLNKNSEETPYENKKLSKNEKAVIIMISIVLVVIAGFLEKSFFEGTSVNPSASSVNTAVSNHSNDAPETAENIDTNISAGTTIKNSGSRTSTNRATENSGTTRSTNRTIGNRHKNSSSGEIDGSTSPSSDDSAKNTAASSSGGNSARNTASSSPSGDSAGNTATNSSSGSSTENTAANSSGNTSSSSQGTIRNTSDN